jgi:sugar lactone lactonase YvrE
MLFTNQIAMLSTLVVGILTANVAHSQSYTVETIKVPADIRLEVGGMAFWPDGTLVMCTRRGEVWKYKNGQFRQFVFGLHEPLGLYAGEVGEIWVMQRGELTRITDEDGDGEADNFEALNQQWGYTGNYHQYAFGLVRDREGSFYGTLGLGFYRGGDRFKGTWLGTQDDIKYRGWVLKFTADGKRVPFAVGLRAPNGIALSPAGEIFTTDNQGSYIACGWLMHVREGDFIGHPSGLIDDPRYPEPWKMTRDELLKLRKRPAVFLPHGTMGNSTSQPLWDTTNGKFGPFAGQTFVGDVQNGRLSRICLERVKGEYQGAAIPFIYDKLGGGVNRLVYDQQGTLWVGMTGRGWAAGEGLKKITYTGKIPHAIHSMKLTKTGFRLTFTKPIDPVRAADLANYSLRHFELEWHAAYGAPLAKSTVVKPTKIDVAKDNLSVTLHLPEIKTKKIYELHITNLPSITGEKLEHPMAFYTLNNRL